VTKILFFIGLLFLFSQQSNAQVFFSGKVVDSISKTPLASVRVENGELKSGTKTDDSGSFAIKVRLGDHLIFSMVGRKNRVIQITEATMNKELIVLLPIKPYLLKPVLINQERTAYQIDSAKRANIYEDVINYDQQKSVMSPITTVYQKFSKKYKNIRHLQEQMASTEEQKFIDTRYTPELVQMLTKLPLDSVPNFMNAFPMEYDYARAASELEIKMWVKYNYQEFAKRRKTLPQKR
jgi:hypothetical protein